MKNLRSCTDGTQGYYLVSRTFRGKVKFLCMPRSSKKRISWSQFMSAAKRFQDGAEAQAEADVWISGKIMRFTDGI